MANKPNQKYQKILSLCVICESPRGKTLPTIAPTVTPTGTTCVIGVASSSAQVVVKIRQDRSIRSREEVAAIPTTTTSIFMRCRTTVCWGSGYIATISPSATALSCPIIDRATDKRGFGTTVAALPASVLTCTNYYRIVC